MTHAVEHLQARTQDGVVLPVEVRGQGPVVIFVNGLTQTTAHWRTQLKLFSDSGWRAACFNGRGQGEVPAPQDLSREHHAWDLAAVQDALGVDACHVVGFSHGSRVAIAHALRFPERVGRLVLVAPSGGLTPARRIIVEGWRDVAAHLGPEALALVSLPWILSDHYLNAHAQEIPGMMRAAIRRNSPQGTLAMLEGLLRDPGSEEELARIQAPTLLMGGVEDRFAAPEHIRALAARMPSARTAFVPGAGHTVSIEKPEEFHQIIQSFLKEA